VGREAPGWLGPVPDHHSRFSPSQSDSLAQLGGFEDRFQHRYPVQLITAGHGERASFHNRVVLFPLQSIIQK